MAAPNADRVMSSLLARIKICYQSNNETEKEMHNGKT